MSLEDDLVVAKARLADHQEQRRQASADEEAAHTAGEHLDELITADEAEVKRILDEIAAQPVQNVLLHGIWPEGPDLPTYKVNKHAVGLDNIVTAFRESGGRGSLDDPLFKVAVKDIPPNTLMAVEIDPRRGGHSQRNYIDGTLAARSADIDRLTKSAGANAKYIAYVEGDSEGNLPEHAPANQSVEQKRKGCVTFNIAVGKALLANAPGVKFVPSFTRGLFVSNRFGDPHGWLPPELVAIIKQTGGGIGVDGYSFGYKGAPMSPDTLFSKAIQFITSLGLPTYITEWGVSEHPGDGGKGKAAEYDVMTPWLSAHKSKDGGKTGVVHIMVNYRHDPPAPAALGWKYDTTPPAKASFLKLVQAVW